MKKDNNNFMEWDGYSMNNNNHNNGGNGIINYNMYMDEDMQLCHSLWTVFEHYGIELTVFRICSCDNHTDIYVNSSKTLYDFKKALDNADCISDIIIAPIRGSGKCYTAQIHSSDCFETSEKSCFNIVVDSIFTVCIYDMINDAE